MEIDLIVSIHYLERNNEYRGNSLFFPEYFLGKNFFNIFEGLLWNTGSKIVTISTYFE